jgi:hypothetical protein
MDPDEALVVHEKSKGAGEVYDGEQLLAEVDYSLKDVEELHGGVSQPPGASGLRAGLRNVYGVVAASEPNTLAGYVGGRLTLRLDDGRQLDFTISKVMGSRRFLIQGLERFR